MQAAQQPLALACCRESVLLLDTKFMLDKYKIHDLEYKIHDFRIDNSADEFYLPVARHVDLSL